MNIAYETYKDTYHNFGIIIPVKKDKNQEENVKYIFLFVVESKPFFTGSKFYIRYILKPFFVKIANLIEIERGLRNSRNFMKKRTKNKYRYVYNAELALHHLRNKFSPIVNFFEMVAELKTIDVSKKSEFQGLINLEEKRIKVSIASILHKADLILEKSNNPFYISSFEVKSMNFIFGIVRSMWQDYFKTDNIKLLSDEKHLKKEVLVNEEAFEIVITDIIENMHSFNNGLAEVSISFDGNKDFIIEFKNNFKQSELLNIKEVVEDFMSDGNMEVLRRKSHGLSQIKILIDQMKIKYEMYIEKNELIIFKIYFTTHENSNI
jgi:hypothetical protein